MKKKKRSGTGWSPNGNNSSFINLIKFFLFSFMAQRWGNDLPDVEDEGIVNFLANWARDQKK
jgi:hypothetical protein